MRDETNAVLEQAPAQIGSSQPVEEVNATIDAEWAGMIAESPGNWNLAIEMSNPDWGETWAKCSC